MQIQINPSFDALYYSPYLLGLERLFGASSLSYRGEDIPDFGHHGLAVTTTDGTKTHRIFISASDGSGINRKALAWSDVYAKVNIDEKKENGESTGKLMAIGPSFPVRIWPPISAIARGIISFFAGGGRAGSFRRHFASYRAQWRYRVSEDAYRPSRADEEYIFFASRLWLKEPTTNSYRAEFIRAGRSADGLRFEGGFVPRARRDIEGFEELTVESSYSMKEYLNGVRRSLVAFNTPAVSGCHGWKLAEYLALGKAIITTPLTRALPSPLEHGRHVHVVDGSFESIRSAIQKIRADGQYRSRLERNARLYYERLLAPDVVISRIVASLGTFETRLASGRDERL